MNEKEKKAVEAAILVFFRYGVRKTTMADIATAAGMSRQTLYAAFASKNEILAAAIGRVCDDTLATIRAAWRTQETLAAKLDAFFEIGAVRIYDQIQVKPDSQDFENDTGEAGDAAIARANERKSRALTEILTPYRQALDEAGLTPEALADFVQTSVAGYKQSARDREHLLALLGALKAVLLKAAGN